MGRGRSSVVLWKGLSFGYLHADPADHIALKGLAYDRGDSGEVRNLLHVKAGSNFNLSTEEIGKLRTLGRQFRSARPQDQTVLDAVSAAYCQIFGESYRPYRQEGSKAIMPYDCGSDRCSDPAKEPQIAADQSKLLKKWYPDFYQLMATYLDDLSAELNMGDGEKLALGETEHIFYWSKQQIVDRPAFILAHRLFHHVPEGVVYVTGSWGAVR